MTIEIFILCEDQARMGFLDRKFIGQHGLSLFIRSQENILFDVGPSDAFLYNAKLLGIDVGSAKWVVLSHGHWDHGDGLAYWPAHDLKTNLLAHPLVFARRHKPSGEFNGLTLGQKQIEHRFNTLMTPEPFQISDTIWFLGQVPRQNDFEALQTPFFRMEEDRRLPDFLEDDTGLAIKTSEGLIVISGCAHAGICNICDYAMEVTGEKRLAAVVGGFHLLNDSEQVTRTVDYFQKRTVKRIYPMHCTALPALARFYHALKIEKLCAGDVIRFP